MADARHEFVASSVGLVHLRTVPVISSDGGQDERRMERTSDQLGRSTSFKVLKRKNSRKAGGGTHYRALSGVSFQNSVNVVTTTSTPPPSEMENASFAWKRNSSPSVMESTTTSSNPIRVTFIQRIVTDYEEQNPRSQGLSDYEEDEVVQTDEHIYDTVDEGMTSSGSDLSGESDNLSGLDLSIFEPGSSNKTTTTATGFIYRPPRPSSSGSSITAVTRTTSFRERLKKNLLPKLLFSNSNNTPEPPTVDYEPEKSKLFLKEFLLSKKTIRLTLVHLD